MRWHLYSILLFSLLIKVFSLANFNDKVSNFHYLTKRAAAELLPEVVAFSDCGGEGGGDADSDKSKSGNCGKSMQGGGNANQKALNIAVKAAQEAKSALDSQQAAGHAASVKVKTQLAEKAMSAAKAAEAALAGKQQMVQQLESEVREAEAVVQEQCSSLENAQQNVAAAQKAAENARSQLVTLTKAVETAKANVGNSEQAAAGAQQDLAEKTQLLEAAKSRVEHLLRQLKEARTDFSKTKQAAYKAACAAHQAKANISRDRRMLKRRYSNST